MMHTTHNEEETKKVAEAFAMTLKGGEVIFLFGDLGMGKTTFVRGAAEYFGFLDPVRSPSFTIVNRYLINTPGLRQILHVDFYRIEDPSEIWPLALEEEVGQPDTMTFIEWPEKAEGNTHPATHKIYFTSTDGVHHISIQ
ncbi:tRNA (adenosine(37)-N6)-threonylcarbamoyltransferase complex ATPase subunit type 1 TsaE [Candidatus Uhrbacteria bacterium]|nr:tRNA (adenosine(37)-N6)-threonylcarbamoyltransferase complex ATPase subunit type 1 TsaE [Candidatus Uhrbacteria bacterium]